MRALLIALGIAFSIFTALPSLYLLILTIAAWARRQQALPPLPPPRSLFAVMVPAHNEEALLPRLLRSLSAQSYPEACFSVFVVADNCEDKTAEVGRNFGARVYERTDAAHVGKGYALQWLLQQTRQACLEIDAYVFVDADCTVSSNLLEVMESYLRTGHQAVQSLYTALDPYASTSSTLRDAALYLKHQVRPRGRAALGLPSGLFGTGMAFRREVVDRLGWDTFGLAEDAEYHLRLMDEGVRVAFAQEARVWGEMPSSLAAARGQNLRWEKGRIKAACRFGPRLLRRAFQRRSWAEADAVIEQVMPPLSAIALGVCSLAVVSTLARLPAWLVGVGWGGLLALTVHVFGGLLLCQVPFRSYRAFAYAPVLLGWKLVVYATALFPTARSWERTQRS